MLIPFFDFDLLSRFFFVDFFDSKYGIVHDVTRDNGITITHSFSNGKKETKLIVRIEVKKEQRTMNTRLAIVSIKFNFGGIRTKSSKASLDHLKSHILLTQIQRHTPVQKKIIKMTTEYCFGILNILNMRRADIVNKKRETKRNELRK